MLRIYFILMVWLMAIACQSSEARRPINKQKQVFLKESAKRNKNILSIEQNLFQQVMERHKNLSFKATPQGFWYALQKKSDQNTSFPNKGNLVTFRYRIKDLSGNLIYDEEELGTVTYLVDQEELIPALREGVKYLKPGEIGVFLFPSYLCFGYQGDGDKIGINQALEFTIELINLEI